MNPYNLFSTNRDDFSNLMNINGELIFVNGEPKRALISNKKEMSNLNDKYISTNFNMNRGDIVFWDSKYWIITSQVGAPRYESYKAIIRQVEHDIIFNISFAPNSPQKYLLKCLALVQQTSDFGLEYSRLSETISVQSEIHLFVQDNEKTRHIIQLANSSNGRIIFGRRSFEITGVSTANKGILDITCTLTTKSQNDDYEIEIYNPPINFEYYIDDSMYEIKDGASDGSNELQLPEVSVRTNVGTISIKNSFLSYDVTWSNEINKDNYLGFTGYRVRVYRETLWGAGDLLEEQVVTIAETNISEHVNGDYGLLVTIESIFTDGVTTIFTQPQEQYFNL